MGKVDTNVLGKPAHISDAEWRLRIELAAAYRVFDWYGWNETIFNHITVRVPGPERHFLINPFGLWYDEVTAANLVKVDLAGNPVALLEQHEALLLRPSPGEHQGKRRLPGDVHRHVERRADEPVVELPGRHAGHV